MCLSIGYPHLFPLWSPLCTNVFISFRSLVAQNCRSLEVLSFIIHVSPSIFTSLSSCVSPGVAVSANLCVELLHNDDNIVSKNSEYYLLEQLIKCICSNFSSVAADIHSRTWTTVIWANLE